MEALAKEPDPSAERSSGDGTEASSSTKAEGPAIKPPPLKKGGWADVVKQNASTGALSAQSSRAAARGPAGRGAGAGQPVESRIPPPRPSSAHSRPASIASEAAVSLPSRSQAQGEPELPPRASSADAGVLSPREQAALKPLKPAWKPVQSPTPDKQPGPAALSDPDAGNAVAWPSLGDASVPHRKRHHSVSAPSTPPLAFQKTTPLLGSRPSETARSLSIGAPTDASSGTEGGAARAEPEGAPQAAAQHPRSPQHAASAPTSPPPSLSSGKAPAAQGAQQPQPLPQQPVSPAAAPPSGPGQQRQADSKAAAGPSFSPRAEGAGGGSATQQAQASAAAGGSPRQRSEEGAGLAAAAASPRSPSASVNPVTFPSDTSRGGLQWRTGDDCGGAGREGGSGPAFPMQFGTVPATGPISAGPASSPEQSGGASGSSGEGGAEAASAGPPPVLRPPGGAERPPTPAQRQPVEPKGSAPQGAPRAGPATEDPQQQPEATGRVSGATAGQQQQQQQQQQPGAVQQHRGSMPPLQRQQQGQGQGSERPQRSGGAERQGGRQAQRGEGGNRGRARSETRDSFGSSSTEASPSQRFLPARELHPGSVGQWRGGGGGAGPGAGRAAHALQGQLSAGRVSPLGGSYLAAMGPGGAMPYPLAPSLAAAQQRGLFYPMAPQQPLPYFPQAAAYGLVPPMPQQGLTGLGDLGDAVLRQVEYYLSGQNLCKDFHLRKLMDDEGWVPLAVVTNFKRMKQLTLDPFFVLDALQASSVVETTPDGDCLRPHVNWHQWPLPVEQRNAAQRTEAAEETARALAPGLGPGPGPAPEPPPVGYSGAGPRGHPGQQPFPPHRPLRGSVSDVGPYAAAVHSGGGPLDGGGVGGGGGGPSGSRGRGSGGRKGGGGGGGGGGASQSAPLENGAEGGSLRASPARSQPGAGRSMSRTLSKRSSKELPAGGPGGASSSAQGGGGGPQRQGSGRGPQQGGAGPSPKKPAGGARGQGGQGAQGEGSHSQRAGPPEASGAARSEAAQQAAAAAVAGGAPTAGGPKVQKLRQGDLQRLLIFVPGPGPAAGPLLATESLKAELQAHQRALMEAAGVPPSSDEPPASTSGYFPPFSHARSLQHPTQQPATAPLMGSVCWVLGPPPRNGTRVGVSSAPPGGQQPPGGQPSRHAEGLARFQEVEYARWEAHCLADRTAKGPGRSAEMSLLYHFLSEFLRLRPSDALYAAFGRWAAEDAAHGSQQGRQHLFRSLSYGLVESFDEPLYRFFEEEVLKEFDQGGLFGLEKMWAFHVYRGKPADKPPLQLHPRVKRLLSEDYASLEDFKRKPVPAKERAEGPKQAEPRPSREAPEAQPQQRQQQQPEAAEVTGKQRGSLAPVATASPAAALQVPPGDGASPSGTPSGTAADASATPFFSPEAKLSVPDAEEGMKGKGARGKDDPPSGAGAGDAGTAAARHPAAGEEGEGIGQASPAAKALPNGSLPEAGTGPQSKGENGLLGKKGAPDEQGKGSAGAVPSCRG